MNLKLGLQLEEPPSKLHTSETKTDWVNKFLKRLLINNKVALIEKIILKDFLNFSDIDL